MLANSKMGGGKLNKAFTLIEVISAIVIIGVIAVITVPITIRVINESKRRSFYATAEGIIKATLESCIKNEEDYGEYFLENEMITFKFSKNEGKEGESVEEINGKKIRLSFEGKAPIGGEVHLYKNGNVEVVNLTDGTYYANKDADTELVVSDTSNTLTRGQLQIAVEKLQAQMEQVMKKNEDQDEKDKELENSITSIDVLAKTYPVGSIYISENSTNPSTLFGGTWERYGEGRTLVSLTSTDERFNTVSKIGGNNEVTLTASQLPSHAHSIPALTGSTNETGAHTHTRGTMDITGAIGQTGAGEPKFGSASGSFYGITTTNYYSKTVDTSGSTRHDGIGFTASRSWTGATSSNGAHTHTITTDAATTGTVGSTDRNKVSVLQPYITVYMWKRVS